MNPYIITAGLILIAAIILLAIIIKIKVDEVTQTNLELNMANTTVIEIKAANDHNVKQAADAKADAMGLTAKLQSAELKLDHVRKIVEAKDAEIVDLVRYKRQRCCDTILLNQTILDLRTKLIVKGAHCDIQLALLNDLLAGYLKEAVGAQIAAYGAKIGRPIANGYVVAAITEKGVVAVSTKDYTELKKRSKNSKKTIPELLESDPDFVQCAKLHKNN